MKLTDLKIQSNRVKVIAVTKGRSVEEITNFLSQNKVAGIAENRLQEAQAKFLNLDPKIPKHFIGALQSRKIKEIVEIFDCIQSVENLKQAEKISQRAVELRKNIQIFIQVNLNDAKNRLGAHPDQVSKLISEIRKLANIELLGLMGIASQDPILSRKEFKTLKSLQADLPELSMGMSSDYQIALEEGSTMLRLGSILFDSLSI